jgi:DNA-binding LytR/AlgR family response regulator
MKIKTIIVDDEPGAHMVLENYIGRLPDMELVGKFLNPNDALEFVRHRPVDLILLDVSMPVVGGFVFLSFLEKQPLVIFTTAYEEYALQSYEVGAVDYLRKPILFDRFAKAFEKVKERLESLAIRDVRSSISLLVDGVYHEFQFTDVQYFQSFGNYVKIFADNGVFVTLMTTKELEDLLPRQRFIRIHKSYIVNRTKITNVSDSDVVIGSRKIPIGKTFKMYFRSSNVGHT